MHPSRSFLFSLLAFAGGCNDRRPRPPALQYVERAPPPNAPPLVQPAAASLELEPGTLRAFGVLLPASTIPQFQSDNVQMFYVAAPMPRVMRYLQRRLEIVTADIHPLAVMVRGAHVVTTEPGVDIYVDVGVRDEGDRTLVSIWNRTSAPVPSRSMDDGLRAAGFDPVTKRPTGENSN